MLNIILVKKKIYSVVKILNGAILILTLMCISYSFSQKYFSGIISRDTRWMGDIHIDGDVIVQKGVILSIEGGTRILVKPNFDNQESGKDKQRVEIVINGVISARGNSPQNPIIFSSESSQPQMNDWYGIVIKNLYDKSILNRCLIEYGYKGITCYGSAPEISESEIRFNYNSGISCEVRAKPLITQCILVGNGFAGINCELASTPQISRCVITQNTYGIIAFSRSEPDLGHFPLNEAQSRGENRIFNNFDFDVYNHTINNIYAQNNYWNTNQIDLIVETVFDNSNNPSYGQVVIQPIFSEKPRRRLSTPSIAFRELVADTQQSLEFADLNESGSLPTELPGDTNQSVSQPYELDTNEVLSEISAVKPETVLAENIVEPPPNEEPALSSETFIRAQEPILETFLDSGKREYVKRSVPDYPEIYRKTGVEGDVLFEVIVGRDGLIENFRVLKSDGDLFTEASIRVLKRFVYKPGTFNGIPVKYKIVERFRFKKSN